MEKERKAYERERSLVKRKKDQSRKFKPSPPPKKIGNIQGIKNFCTHCTPSLAVRIDKKQDALLQMKEEYEIHET